MVAVCQSKFIQSLLRELIELIGVSFQRTQLFQAPMGLWVGGGMAFWILQGTVAPAPEQLGDKLEAPDPAVVIFGVLPWKQPAVCDVFGRKFQFDAIVGSY